MDRIRRAGPLCLLLAIGLLGSSACVENEPQGLGPVSVSVFSDGEKPVTTFDLISNAFANHPVGEPLPTFSFTWSLNGAVLDPQPVDPQRIPAAMTTKNDVWEVTATAAFGSEIIGPDTASITILNSQPTVVVDRITNANHNCPDVPLTVVTTPNDDDGDVVTLTYTWSVNFVEVPGVDSDTLDCSYFVLNDRVRVAVRPFDGEEFGRTEQSNVYTVRAGTAPIPAVAAATASAASASPSESEGAAANSPASITTQTPAASGQALDVTEANACHLGPEGAIACTGEEGHGITASPSGRFTRIALELDYACALRSDDATLVCWGEPVEDVGQLDPPGGAFAQLGLGSTAACALSLDGAIACWGEDPHGLTSPPSGLYVALDVAQSTGCAADADGAVTCWGQGDHR